MLNILLVAVPVLILPGMLGVAVYCVFSEAKKKKAGQPAFIHPDKDMPLYNRGPCDRYSVGAFYW